MQNSYETYEIYVSKEFIKFNFFFYAIEDDNIDRQVFECTFADLFFYSFVSFIKQI